MLFLPIRRDSRWTNTTQITNFPYMAKTFPVQLPEELHRQLKHASIDEGISLHDWIVKTLEERVKNDAPKRKGAQTNARNSRTAR